MSRLFIVAGTARSGKSLLARRLSARYGVPYFGLDFLVSGLHGTAPAYENLLDMPDWDKAELLRPIIENMIGEILFSAGGDYLLEGVYFRPEYMAPLQERYPTGQIRYAFMGYPTADPQRKMENILKYKGIPGDWLSSKPAHELGWFVDHMIAHSRQIEAQCKAYGMPYFDTSEDFEGTLNAVESYLMTPPEKDKKRP